MKWHVEDHFIELLQRCLIASRTSLFAISKGSLLNLKGFDFQDDEVFSKFGQ